MANASAIYFEAIYQVCAFQLLFNLQDPPPPGEGVVGDPVGLESPSGGHPHVDPRVWGSARCAVFPPEGAKPLSKPSPARTGLSCPRRGGRRLREGALPAAAAVVAMGVAGLLAGLGWLWAAAGYPK